MTTRTINPEIPNGAVKYFTNCRGVNYLPTIESQWKASGYLPRYDPFLASSVFSPIFPSPTYYHDASNVFCGSNKTSQWYYYSDEDNDIALKRLREIGINAIRVFLDLYVWALDSTKFINNLRSFMSLCDKHKMRVQLVIWDGIEIAFIPYSEPLPSVLSPREMVNRALACRWTSMPPAVELANSGARETFYTTCAVPYVTDIVNNTSEYQSMWSYDVLNENYGLFSVAVYAECDTQIELLASSTAQLIASLNPPANIAITAGQGGYEPYPESEYFPTVMYSLSSVLNVGSMHPYQNSRYFLKKYINESASGASGTGLPAMINELTFTESYAPAWSQISYLDEFDFGALIFDGFIEYSFSFEPFNSEQGLIFPDGQFRKSQDAEAYLRIANNTGWFSQNQLKQNYTVKEISSNSGIDGGYWSGTMPEHIEYNSVLSVSSTEPQWDLSKLMYYSLPILSPENPKGARNYPPVKGNPMSVKLGFSWADEDYTLSSLIEKVYNYSSLYVPLNSYTTDKELLRNRDVLERNEILKFVTFTLFEADPGVINVFTNQIGTSRDYSPVASSLRLDLSAAYNSVVITANPGVNNMHSLTSISISNRPCHGALNCFYVGDPGNGIIDWAAYDTAYDDAFDKLRICLDALEEAAEINPDYRAY